MYFHEAVEAKSAHLEATVVGTPAERLIELRRQRAAWQAEHFGSGTPPSIQQGPSGGIEAAALGEALRHAIDALEAKLGADKED